MLDRLISDAALSPRARNCLLVESIETNKDLVKWTEKDLMRIPNFGPRSLAEVKEYISQLPGLKLGMSDEDINQYKQPLIKLAIAEGDVIKVVDKHELIHRLQEARDRIDEAIKALNI